MKILEQLFVERNINKKSTKDTYKIPVKQYEKLHKQTLDELIQEADNEEEERIRLKNRRIKTRLLEFRQYMINKELSINTINARMVRITTIYRHFEIEIPRLPPFQHEDEEFERYNDIPTIEDIKKVIENISNPKQKAIILFMASSGTALNETIHLTVNDFIKATKDYHDNNKDIQEILNQLEQQKDIIPLFEMIRLKTNYPYYTCCSPEATKSIVIFLKTRKNISLEDKLFKYGKTSMLSMFQRINSKMGWGRVKGRRFFRSHALRKFNATAIEDVNFANTIQGRQADSITKAYFKHNPKRIKEKYLEHLPKLTINETIVNTIDDEGTKRIKELEKQVKKSDENLKELEERYLEYEKRMDEIIKGRFKERKEPNETINTIKESEKITRKKSKGILEEDAEDYPDE